MNKMLSLLVILAFSAAAHAESPCRTRQEMSSANPVCVPDRNPVTRLTQASQHDMHATKPENGRPLSREELKREVAEEKTRKKKAEQARIKQKRCAYLEEKMNAAHDAARAATGKNLEEAERKSRHATEKYVEECPK